MQPVSSFVSHRRGAVHIVSIVKNNGISLLFGFVGGGRRAQSLYCAISLAERRNKAIAPYEPTPAMTIEAQSASFNFANTLICAVGSSARRAVPAAIKTSPFPNARLRAHG